MDRGAHERDSTAVPSFISHIRILTATEKEEVTTGKRAKKLVQKHVVERLGKDPVLEVRALRTDK